MSAGPHQDPEQPQEPTGPTVNDRRRIDPETGEVRPTQETASGGAPAGSDASAADPGSPSAPADPNLDQQLAQAKTALADRTADLQRLQAEYVNYKRRVDRDRDVSRAAGVESVLRELLSVLDNIRSAREHEQMSAGFRAVSEEIERVTTKSGLVSFGAVGDAFDPHVHEALMHSEVSELNGEPITGPTCVAILQPGYLIKERVVRPARVAVAEPSGEAAAAESAPAGE